MKKKLTKKQMKNASDILISWKKKDAVLLWNGYNHCIFDSPIQVI